MTLSDKTCKWVSFSRGLILKFLLLFVLFFLLLYHILLRILNQKELFLSLHFAANIAAVERPVPFFLILLGVKLHIDVGPLLVFLHSEH